MRLRWLLACSLALCCSLAVGCGGSDVETNSGPKASSEQTEASKSAKTGLEAVKTSLTKTVSSIKSSQELSRAIATASSNTNPRQPTGANQKPTPKANQSRSPKANDTQSARVNRQPAPHDDDQETATKVKQVTATISAASDELRLVEPEVAYLKEALNGPDTKDDFKSVEAIETSVREALTKLNAATDALEDIKGNSTELSGSLNEALEEIQTTALPAANRVKIPDNLKPPSSWPKLWDIGIWVAIILGAILVLVLLISAVRAYRTLSAARADARLKTKLQPLASVIQKQQAEVASRIAELTTSQNDLRTKVADLEYQLSKVARIAREAANDGAARRAPASPPTFSSYEEPVARDEPQFPISIGDYLSKMQRSSNIVRPDFQNDILVSDPGGTGELVLIRDAGISDDLQPLFVIPRATQFQTKQDFYTYYQKYYECARPSAGDVWIIDPAVVSRVSGGWQLREKGVLEVR